MAIQLETFYNQVSAQLKKPMLQLLPLHLVAENIKHVPLEKSIELKNNTYISTSKILTNLYPKKNNTRLFSRRKALYFIRENFSNPKLTKEQKNILKKYTHFGRFQDLVHYNKTEWLLDKILKELVEKQKMFDERSREYVKKLVPRFREDPIRIARVIEDYNVSPSQTRRLIHKLNQNTPKNDAIVERFLNLKFKEFKMREFIDQRYFEEIGMD